jgi:RNA polymerase sigma-70 factor (ECF subfamily)
MLIHVNEHDVATLYREYGYLVFRRCVVYLGEPDAARDATREVFVRALRNFASFRAFADARTWLCRTTDDVCIDILRRRTPDHAGSDAVDDAALEAAIGDDDRESLLTSRRLMADLDIDSLRLAVLFYVDELTEDELARELGWSRRTVEKRISSLLEHVRARSQARSAS